MTHLPYGVTMECCVDGIAVLLAWAIHWFLHCTIATRWGEAILKNQRITRFLFAEFIGSATVIEENFSEAFQINRLRDLEQYVPNMKTSQLGQMGGTFISLRGISSNPFVVNRTSVYIDGIPYREINNQLLHDINQIEILKGPQGTLYGSNTEAGVIVITQTDQPRIFHLNLC